MKNQFATLANKVRVLEEQNDLLKTQNGELAKLRAISEKFNCDKMTVDDEVQEPKSKSDSDIEMGADDGDRTAVLPPVENGIKLENADVPYAHDSTSKDDSDDLNAFEDSLFNTKIENPKEFSFVAQKAPESIEESITDQCEPPAFLEVATTESECVSIPKERNAFEEPEMVTTEIDPIVERSVADAASPPAPPNTATKDGSISMVEQELPSENASGTFTLEDASDMLCVAAASITFTADVEEMVSSTNVLSTIVEETTEASTSAPENLFQDDQSSPEPTEKHVSSCEEAAMSVEESAAVLPLVSGADSQSTQDSSQPIEEIATNMNPLPAIVEESVAAVSVDGGGSIEEHISDVNLSMATVEKTDAALTFAAENGTRDSPIEESATDVLPTIALQSDAAENYSQNSTESCGDIDGEIPETSTVPATGASSDAATIGSECSSIPNSQSSSLDCTEMATDRNTVPIEIAEPSAAEMVIGSDAVIAPETATVGKDSEFSNEVAELTGTLSDTNSADTETASIPPSQQSTDIALESMVAEIRAEIIDAVLSKSTDTDQPDSDAQFVNESQATKISEMDTLDDIVQLIEKERDEQASAQCSAGESKIEIHTPQPAMETREPISAQFNPSQIVSLDYTASGTEILTLDVPVSHETSSMAYDLDESLQFSSDIGEERDYLLPPRQSGVTSKLDETMSSQCSQSINDTANYSADGELDSASSSSDCDKTVVLSSDALDVDSSIQPAVLLPTKGNRLNIPSQEKICKRKLSIADDGETEFLLSKSRKPEEKSTPFRQK